MRILVDMDGVIADFEEGFLQNWRINHPDKFFVPVEERNTFKITDQYPAEMKGAVHQIYCAPDFFLKIRPIPGSLEALLEMKRKGIEVYICTSPLQEYKNCVAEKYEWVDQHLGRDWTNRVILTRDKTLIRADILIDDKPKIDGSELPGWEHVIYDQPYNRAETSKKRLNWQNWKQVLLFN